MVSSTTMAIAGSSAAVVATLVMECRSSSSPAFGSVRFAPTARRSNALKANATVRASASEEPKAVRQVMVGLLAAGAILVTGVLAFAFTGPGGDGAATTAKGSNKLLNEADKLTKEDSPPTFKEGVQDAGSTTKQAGSAGASNVQIVADDSMTKAKAKESFSNVIPNKVSNASSVTNQAYTVSDASSAINNAKNSASSAVDDAKSALSSLGDKLIGNSSTTTPSNRVGSPA
jgi:hypothetical protein